MATSLPPELLQQIYTLLTPTSLQAARHTCSNWRSAALCTQSIRLMASRSGWSACLPDTPLSHQQLLNIERLLEREDTLAGSHISAPSTTRNGGGFRLARTLDFTALAFGPIGGNARPVGMAATLSIDTNFLLLTSASTIFVYRIAPYSQTFLTPVTSITCPRRVEKVTMDASGGRHSVAALLEGRSACICDLDDMVGKSGDVGGCEVPSGEEDGESEGQGVNVIQVDATHQSVILYNAPFEGDVSRRGVRDSQQDIAAPASADS